MKYIWVVDWSDVMGDDEFFLDPVKAMRSIIETAKNNTDILTDIFFCGGTEITAIELNFEDLAGSPYEVKIYREIIADGEVTSR